MACGYTQIYTPVSIFKQPSVTLDNGDQSHISLSSPLSIQTFSYPCYLPFSSPLPFPSNVTHLGQSTTISQMVLIALTSVSAKLPWRAFYSPPPCGHIILSQPRKPSLTSLAQVLFLMCLPMHSAHILTSTKYPLQVPCHMFILHC